MCLFSSVSIQYFNKIYQFAHGFYKILTISFFMKKQCAAVCFIAISQDTFYFLRMCAGRQTIVFLKNWNRKIVQSCHSLDLVLFHLQGLSYLLVVLLVLLLSFYILFKSFVFELNGKVSQVQNRVWIIFCFQDILLRKI